MADEVRHPDPSDDTPMFGRSQPRVEDDRLLRGAGRYVDDLHIPDALEVAFLRSTEAHARITSIDVSAARAHPGIVAVYDGASVAGRIEPLLNAEELRVPPGIAALGVTNKLQPAPILAIDEVGYVGQPVAMVVAESRYLAEDAVELITVDYEPLPAVIDAEAALAPDAPLALLGEDDNIGVHVRHGNGDADAAIANAAAVITDTFWTQRYVCAPLEPRGLVAQTDPFTGALTVWSTTQTPHRVRDHIAGSIGIDLDDVRVQAVDVGGGFGQKGILVVEELLIPFAAVDLGRPVRWIADRFENLTADAHAREQTHHITLAADADGRLVAVKDRIVVNLGARNMVGLVVPYNALCHLIGPYSVANADLEAIGVLTNTTYTSPYRGAGRPEATFAMERAMDRLALALGIEPIELRRRNLITPDQMPYRTGLLDRRGIAQEYDSGDYPQMLERAVEMIDLGGIRRRQSGAATGATKRLGVGFAMYLEMTGLGPFEGARVDVMPSGRIRLYTGCPSQGQGHRTVFAQILADGRRRAPSRTSTSSPATPRPSPTGSAPSPAGPWSPPATPPPRPAVCVKRADPRRRSRGAGSQRRRPRPSRTAGSPWPGPRRSASTLAELIRSVPKLVGGSGSDGLSETSYFQPPNYATASGDPRRRRRGRHHDRADRHRRLRRRPRGRPHRQPDGGRRPDRRRGRPGHRWDPVRAPALRRRGVNRSRRPSPTTSMPVSAMVPEIRLDEIVCPSPTNPLGVKGLGEGGAVGPPAAVANAVEDALADRGVVIRSGPLTPSRVLDLLREARS